MENSLDTEEAQGKPTPPPKILDMLGDSFVPAKQEPPPIETIPLVKKATHSSVPPDHTDNAPLPVARFDEPEERTVSVPEKWATKRNLLIGGLSATAILVVLLAITAALLGREVVRRGEQQITVPDLEMLARIPVDAPPTVSITPRFGTAPPPSLSMEEGDLTGTGVSGAGQPLHITKAVLCRNVTGFARYEPLLEIRLRARHLPLVQLYMEFEGPQPEIREDGRYIYRLAQDIRMVQSDSGQGSPLIDTTVSLTEVAMGPRRDFFASRYLRPSRAAAPGNYMIEVRLTDQVNNTTVTSKIPVTIISD